MHTAEEVVTFRSAGFGICRDDLYNADTGAGNTAAAKAAFGYFNGLRHNGVFSLANCKVMCAAMPTRLGFEHSAMQQCTLRFAAKPGKVLTRRGRC